MEVNVIDLEKIAVCQQWMIGCIGGNIILNILALCISDLQPLWYLFSIIFLLAGLVSIAMLCSALKWNAFLIILCVLLACIPLGALIILLVVNRRASARLREAGLHVGFFGVSRKQIEKLKNVSGV